MPNFVMMIGSIAMVHLFLTHWHEYSNILAMGFMHGLIASMFFYFLPDKIESKINAFMGNWIRRFDFFKNITKGIGG